MLALMGAKSVKTSLSPVHDLFFKDVATSIPGCQQALMRLVLSKIEYSWFNWAKVKFAKDSMQGGQKVELRADLVCKVPVTARMQKQLARLFGPQIKQFEFIFLIEHKAQNATLVCQQLAKMMLSLPERKNTLVIPVVIYHGKELWTAPRTLHDLFKKNNPLLRMSKVYKAFHKNIPNFEYRLLDLNKMSKKELASYGLTYEAFPHTLKMIWALGDKKKTEQVLGEILSRAEKLPPAQHRRFVKKALSYIESKYPGLITTEVVVKAAKKVRAKKTLAHNLTLEEYAAQVNMEFGLKKGRKEGIKEGIEQGIEKGKLELVQFMLKQTGVKDVARLTGLSVQKIQKFKKAG